MFTPRRGLLALIGATTMLAAGLLAAPAASAKPKSTFSDGHGAKVTFNPSAGGSREALVIRDRKSDGHSAVGFVQIFDRSLDEWLTEGRVHFDSSGAGSHPKRVIYHLREGRAIRFRACVGDRDEGTFQDCGHLRRDRA